MAEYIEREVAEETAISTIYRVEGGASVRLDDEMHTAMSRIPTADVVEVVRCKDCCFGGEIVDTDGIIRVCGLRDNNQFAVLGTDFCNYGRKG